MDRQSKDDDDETLSLKCRQFALAHLDQMIGDRTIRNIASSSINVSVDCSSWVKVMFHRCIRMTEVEIYLINRWWNHLMFLAVDDMPALETFVEKLSFTDARRLFCRYIQVDDILCVQIVSCDVTGRIVRVLCIDCREHRLTGHWGNACVIHNGNTYINHYRVRNSCRIRYRNWLKVIGYYWRNSTCLSACNDGQLTSDRWLSKVGGYGWLQSFADTLSCAFVLLHNVLIANVRVLLVEIMQQRVVVEVCALQCFLLSFPCDDVFHFVQSIRICSLHT